jgi:hypothetical protein
MSEDLDPMCSKQAMYYVLVLVVVVPVAFFISVSGVSHQRRLVAVNRLMHNCEKRSSDASSVSSSGNTA